MPIPYAPETSQIKFYVPKTLVSDFDNFLENDIPGAVMGFKHYHDWYDQFDEGYEQKIVRGEIYPDATKSRYSNTDNNLNVRFSKKSDVEAGDIVVDEDGFIYLLDWEIPPQPNNKMSRALRCNAMLTFKRFSEEEVVDDIVVAEAGLKTIAANMPCNAYRYDGRPEWAEISYSPGVTPNALTLLSVQYNRYTKNLRIDDQFEWLHETYEIIDISASGLDIYNNRGFITLQTKKKVGGIDYGS